jgi:hypothetical protein
MKEGSENYTFSSLKNNERTLEGGLYIVSARSLMLLPI